MTLRLVGQDAWEAVSRAIEEDVGRGDITTEALIPEGTQGRAWIEAREPFVMAGLDVAGLAFMVVRIDAVSFEKVVEDGAEVGPGDVLASLNGDLSTILTAERVALNLLARLSGIATLTARFAAAIEGTSAQIVDTRKTTPGLRKLEKYAVAVGGGINHRMGLDDAFLIKDNHIKAAGGITEAIDRARNAAQNHLVVEVEVSDLDELDEAIQAGAKMILLDNMDPATVRAAVERSAGRATLEASGGVTLDNVRELAETGVDRISVGALTHSATSVDVALEVE